MDVKLLKEKNDYNENQDLVEPLCKFIIQADYFDFYTLYSGLVAIENRRFRKTKSLYKKNKLLLTSLLWGHKKHAKQYLAYFLKFILGF